MMNWLYKHRLAFFIGTAVIFLAGMFAGFGSYAFMKSPQDTAIKVNGASITMEQFQRTVDAISSQSPQTPSEGQLNQIKKTAIQELVREEVFNQEAVRFGIHVVDPELASYIESAPAFQKGGRFDQDTYVRILRYNMHMTPEQFEAARKKELAFRKLQFLMSVAVVVPKTDFREASQWALMLIKDPKDRQKIAKDPAALQNLVHNAEASAVQESWISSLNSQLRLNIVDPELKSL